VGFLIFALLAFFALAMLTGVKRRWRAAWREPGVAAVRI
jgi:hypothetical protein